jgi:methionyl-tRNA formyltransferase
MSAARIRRFVDAVGFPYSGASTMMDDEVVRILDCQELPDIKIEERMPGKVIWMEEGAPVIVCGEGLLKLNRLVRARDNALIEKLPRFRMRFR